MNPSENPLERIKYHKNNIQKLLDLIKIEDSPLIAYRHFLQLQREKGALLTLQTLFKDIPDENFQNQFGDNK